MTNPVPHDPDALDTWWALHGAGPRYSVVNGTTVDSALLTFKSFKAMQAQGRAPEGYDLDNPALIESAKAAQSVSDAQWADALNHTGTVAAIVPPSAPVPNIPLSPIVVPVAAAEVHEAHATSWLSAIGHAVTPENVETVVALLGFASKFIKRK